MSSHNVTKIRLSIPNGGTDSPYLSDSLSAGQLKALLGSAVQFVVFAPAALTGVVTLQVRHTEASGTPQTLQTSGSADITIAATKAVPVNVGAFRDLRIHSAAAEAAQRDFDIIFQVTVTC